MISKKLLVKNFEHSSSFSFAQLLVLLCIVVLTQYCYAQSDDVYLKPDNAFRLSVEIADKTAASTADKTADTSIIAITFQIADGYYMYRERFQFESTNATLGVPIFPVGKIKYDETFRKDVETYRKTVKIFLPVQAVKPTLLSIVAQGCADRGLCYAPMTYKVRISPGEEVPVFITTDAFVFGQSLSIDSSLPAIDPQSSALVKRSNDVVAETGRIGLALQSGKLLTILPLFFVLGLGLAFTPCVLPMVPILSSIIVGEGSVSRSRGFFLGLIYSLGMALVYTILGIAAGLIGEGLAVYLQAPLVLATFSLMMVGFALSMFGFYDLRMPGFIQTRLTVASQNRRAGKNLGVFTMGALSALIVGPCVVAPLAGALLYISQTRNVVIGGSALFFLAIGMSVPLLLVGLSAGTLLPRAGAWMHHVQRLFGVLMLGVALWMISSLLPVAVQMAGWATLGIGYGAFLFWSRPSGWFAKAFGLTVLAFGLAQLAGVTSGSTNVLRPLAHLYGAKQTPLIFQRIKSSTELDSILATNIGKTVMLDFYADWCVACKEMEKFTFVDIDVRRQLANTLLLQADVTANDVQDRALLKRFELFGPPGIILFNTQGQEIPDSRIIGFQAPKEFSHSIAVLGVN